MQRRSPPSQVLLCCDVLCCCAVQHPLPPPCATRHCHDVVSGRSCVEGGGQGNAGVLVLIVVVSWYLGAFSQHPVAGVQGLPREGFCLW
jgi:hypothetical protein